MSKHHTEKTLSLTRFHFALGYKLSPITKILRNTVGQVTNFSVSITNTEWQEEGRLHKIIQAPRLTL